MALTTFTEFGPVPSRQDTQAVFNTRMPATLNDIATFVTEFNGQVTDINTTVADVTAASDIAGNALAAANYKGIWSALTGALAVPASVSHNDKFWVLKSNIANVTTKQPGVASEWAELIAGNIASVADIYAGVPDKIVAAGQLYTSNAPIATSGTGTYTINLNAGRVFQRTATGNTTLANPTNQAAGQSGVIYFIQDATGGRTLSLGGNWRPINGTPIIDTAANKVNVFSYYVRSVGNISLSYMGAE